MKRLPFLMIALVVIILIASRTMSQTAAAAPIPINGPPQVDNVVGEVCYDTQPSTPIYGDCAVGSPNPADPTKCQELVETYSCDGVGIQFTCGDFSQFITYDKAPKDKNHCHKPSPSQVNIPSECRGQYGSMVLELESTLVSSTYEYTGDVPITGYSCPTGYDLNPTSHTCQKVVDCPVPDPICGNAVVEVGESCDDGNSINGDGCSSTCSIETVNPICGNALIEAGEHCDDGNSINGDGCSASCQVETPTYVCPNLPGGPYTTVPDGYVLKDDGTCVPKTEPVLQNWCNNGVTVPWWSDKPLPPDMVNATFGPCPDLPQKAYWWKPLEHCPTCNLKPQPNTVPVSWATAFGPTAWDNAKVNGDDPAGVMTAVVMNSYSMPRVKLGWVPEQYKYVIYDCDALDADFGANTKVEMIDNGTNWALGECKERIDGHRWLLYVGPVCTVEDVDRTKCHSGNDEQIYINGVLQHPWTSSLEPKRWYKYYVCSLTPSPAMTEFRDGKWQIQYLPGMNSSTNGIFAMKMGWFPWPAGWPEDRSQHSWDYDVDPLKTTNEWAIYFGHVKNPLYELGIGREYHELIWEWFDVPTK